MKIEKIIILMYTKCFTHLQRDREKMFLFSFKFNILKYIFINVLSVNIYYR
jgi:hypothetical protein